MTLKEKFKVLNCTDCDMPYCDIKCTILSTRELETLEKIADDFAIGFAEWCVIRKVSFFDDTLQGMIFTVDLYKTKYTTKEILQIYKIENDFERAADSNKDKTQTN